MSAILSDYVESTQGRAGTPDGNVFFDTTNGTLEFFLDSEVATLSADAGQANKLTASNRPTLATLYAFERATRTTNIPLRQYSVFLEGKYKRAGAYEFVNGRAFATIAEWKNVDASGWNEKDTSSVIQKTVFGAISLGNIEAGSQPYYRLSDGVPVDFARTGPVSENVVIYENGGIDDNAVFEIAVRTFGYSFSSKSLNDLPYDTTDADIGGFALTEAEKAWITAAGYTFADTYTTPTGNFAGMTFSRLSTSANRVGFAGADKDFKDVLLNTSGGTVAECMAKLDALASTDDDINTGTGNDSSTLNGKRLPEWYTVDASGRLVTRAGLFIDNLPASESQKIVQTSDDGTACTYAYYPACEIAVGANAKADGNAWYTVYYKDGTGDSDFNASNAVKVKDKDGTDVIGSVGGTDISFLYDYVGNTQAGLAGDIDKLMIVEVEGDGIATSALTEFTMKKQDVNAVTCAPTLETNI